MLSTMSSSASITVPLMSARGIAKSFSGRKPILHGIDFSVARGEVVSLIGPSGSGKTTFLRCLAMLEPLEQRPRPAETRPRTEQGVRIRGVEDLLVRFAKCCNPLPGDPIVGFITRGRGLTVHARDCLTVVKSVLDRERLISVDEWRADLESGRMTEVFACGTAAVITPVGTVKTPEGEWLVNEGETGPVAAHLRETLLAIQHGEVADAHGWMHRVL